MSESPKTIPDGYHSINTFLVVRNADKAIQFYKKAFGAEERFRMHGPDGKTIMHADLKIGDSVFMLTEESKEMKALSPESIGGSPVTMYVYVKDVDSIFNQAISEGATELKPVRDQFYGDRSGYLRDPFGHLWSIATHMKDLSPDELRKAGEAFFEEMSKMKAH
ncbi:MAG TPA: VOC family protein [Nitrososphaeraceae archaeon]|jgi:PhnB protein|nr:VOC family protein [Nitrososphaeraceae archaeon]